MNSFSRRVCALGATALFFLLAGSPPLDAQSGAISGTVVDQAAKAIAGANVTIKSDSGAVSATATTDDAGHFSATVDPGTYTVETSSPGFALNTRLNVSPPADLAITLNVDAISQSVTVQDSVSLAADLAPSGNTLDASSARTEISNELIHDFMAPTADFAEVVNLAPGTFSTNPNGIGLGQGKTYFRGFPDGDYTMKFDGIPFEDTNTPTHHSWASFPSEWISSTDFDRSPGNASDFGPTNFGGSINLKSPELQADPDIRGTFSYSSWNTKIYSLDFESGLLGPKKQDAVLFNINQMTSDGYQTQNHQQRDAGYGKYQHRFSDKSVLSLYGGVVDIWNDTPNTTNPTRQQVANYGLNYLMDGTEYCTAVSIPNCPVANGSLDPYWAGFSHYHVQTDFEYAHFVNDLGNGWNFDAKAYTTRYWNKQFYQNNGTPPPTVTITAGKPSGVDKLNGYRHAGDTAILSWESKWGIFRTGEWFDWAYTDRYQYPSNPITQLDTPLPNFHEHFITNSFQPFVEYEWHAAPRLVITAGLKIADYQMSLDQYQDNGKTVGCLGGTLVAATTNTPIACVGGAAFTHHDGNYANFLPLMSARYRVWRAWSVYAQAGEGSVIPPSGVFDVPGGNVTVPPKPTLARTYQTGSVLKMNRFTFDLDAFYIHFQNAYDNYTDPNGDVYAIATGPTNSKGIETESTVALGHGFSIYANASWESAKYQEGVNFPNGGEWVANTPKDVQAVVISWQHRNWDVGVINKRVGQMWNDNGTFSYTINGIKIPYPVDMAALINPFDLTNVFVNYTIKNSSHLRGTKIQFGVNNLANSHNIVGITPSVAATATTPFAPSPYDQLNLLPGRSFSITITGGWAPRS